MKRLPSYLLLDRARRRTRLLLTTTMRGRFPWVRGVLQGVQEVMERLAHVYRLLSKRRVLASWVNG
jgi:hypothetical protein